MLFVQQLALLEHIPDATHLGIRHNKICTYQKLCFVVFFYSNNNGEKSDPKKGSDFQM